MSSLKVHTCTNCLVKEMAQQQILYKWKSKYSNGVNQYSAPKTIPISEIIITLLTSASHSVLLTAQCKRSWPLISEFIFYWSMVVSSVSLINIFFWMRKSVLILIFVFLCIGYFAERDTPAKLANIQSSKKYDKLLIPKFIFLIYLS